MKRKLTAALALTGATAMLISGCAGGSKQAADIKPVSNPVAGEVESGVLDGVNLTYAADGGTTQDAQMNAFFNPFAETSGAKISQDSPQTIAKIQSQVKSGNYQWDFVSSYADVINRECGVLFEELDMSKIDTSNVPDGLIGDEKCGVPSIIYGTMLAYDAKSFSGEQPQSWADFFDTKKFPGTRAMYSGDGKVDPASVQAAAIAAGWDPKTEFTAEWAEKGLDKIDSIKNDIVFYGTGAQAQQMLSSGEAKMIAIWTGRALAAEETGTKVGTVWNDWIKVTDYFAIIKGTPNAEAAYYAINYAYGAEQQAKWTEESGYSPANKNAKPKVDPMTEKYLLTSPERQATGVDLNMKLWSDLEAVKPLQDRWASIVAGG